MANEQSSGKFLVFHDVQRVADGLYATSPRHITLAPPLYLTGLPYDFLTDLSDIAADTEPFDVTPGAVGWFGSANDTEVRHINDPEHKLEQLNNRIIAAIGARGLMSYMSLQFPTYNPHSTITAIMPELPDVIHVADLSYYFSTEFGKSITKVPFEK